MKKACPGLDSIPMRSFRGCLVLKVAVGTIVPLLSFSLAYAQPTEIIRGRVVNGTFHNRPVAGESVQLLRMSKESPSTLATAQTGRTGEFAFRGQDEGTYLILVTYRGVEYSSGPFRVSTSVLTIPDVVVYEPTTEQPVISFPYRIVVIDRLGVGVVSIQEIVRIINQSSRTYLGHNVAPDKRVTFGLDIPREAQGVTVLRG
ncbi:MAG: carboxypeptidase-like regulatory domain-containing protein, partial [Candidatus Methylomirabilaceae bacterium]